MFKLKSLKIKNFLSIVDAEVDLHKTGLYLISGYNELGGDSNGCGKSSVLSSLAYALWGETSGGLRGASVCNWDSDGTFFVEAELLGPEGTYLVHRGSDKLEFSINGKVLKGRKGDVQALINEAFHSNLDIFFSSTLFTSEVSEYLTQMGDAGKKKLFKAVLSLDKVDVAYDRAKVLYEEHNKVATKAEYSIDMIQTLMETKSMEIEDLREKEEDWENLRASKIRALQASEAKPVIDDDLVFSLKHKENSIKILEPMEKQMADRAVAIGEETRKAWEDRGKIAGQLAETEDHLSSALSLETEAACDKCGSPLGLTWEQHVSQLRVKQSNFKEWLAVTDSTIQNLDRELAQIEKFSNDMVLARAGMEEMQNELLQQDERMKAWQEERDRADELIKNIESESNPYTELINVQLTDIEEQQKKLTTVKSEHEKSSRLMDYYAFLKTTFSREGVTAQIVESSFGALQALANRYLSRICSEGLMLNISPQRELKTRALKEEIDIYVTDVHKPGRRIPYAALSGGQKQRINIALLMALYRFCRNLGVNDFDFIILDEVLDLSLASKGQADVVNLLRDMLLEVGQIIVVSHKDAISQDFDYEITIRRGTDGVAKII